MRSLLPKWSVRYIPRVQIRGAPGRRSNSFFKLYSSTGPRKDDGWEVVIGLEIHAQLRTGRKLFSNALLSHGDSPNTHIELHDAAFPGSLPVLDHEAIRLSLLTALALNCTINRRSTFDRKHYFYHDIPASYQITQHYNPLARGGRLTIEKGENGTTRDLVVGIQQLQVEQDTAKSQLVGDKRFVDLNRAGTGLMEIVTDPDMRSAEEAGAFVRKLQSLLRRVGSGDGDMEKGNLRVDVNVSVHRPGTPFGTRCEIKNINSVRFLQQAIEYERTRHIAHYTERSSVPIPQETRTFNEVTNETIPLRAKEDAEDYRYMPDANLPAMIIESRHLESLQQQIPEMPWDTVERIVKTYDVPKRDVETLLGLDEYNARGIKFFEEVARGDVNLGKRTLNWVVHEMLGRLYKSGTSWTPDLVPASLMRELVKAIEDGSLTGTVGKTILRHALDQSPVNPNITLYNLLDSLNLSPSSTSSDTLQTTCEEAIAALPDVAKNVRKGKLNAAARIVGEVMKRSQGSADAKRAREIILELLLPQ